MKLKSTGRKPAVPRLRAGLTDSSSSATPLVSSKRGLFSKALGVASTWLRLLIGSRAVAASWPISMSRC